MQVILNASPLVVELRAANQSLPTITPLTHLHHNSHHTFHAANQPFPTNLASPRRHSMTVSTDGNQPLPTNVGTYTNQPLPTNVVTSSVPDLMFAWEKAALVRAKAQTHSPVKLHFRHLSVDSV